MYAGSKEKLMTTPRPDDYIIIATLRDVASLQLVERVLDSQRLVLESQLGQVGKLQEAVKARIKEVK